MKYFKNITTPDELKKQFRAYCVTMHPDKGGDPEEFKAMLNEYEQAAKSCGAWTKETREEVQSVRRGLRVVFFGAGMMETRYIITSVQGDNIKLVRIFSHDFRSIEDVDFYLGGEWSDEDSRRELNKYDHIRPLSQKFGIGYYWDDVDNKTYTEKEISEAERIADNFDRWAANWKANKEEEERRAQEEADREENAIIAQWSSILEKLPEEHKRPDGLSYYDMTNEQREAEKAAIKKINAARLAAFKRNLKAVFNHFWPGVKCSFKISRSVYGTAQITWTDGPTVAEVEACEVFDYFRAYFFASDQYSDYGDVKRREYLKKFRQMFGAFDCDNIDYTRKLSEKTADKVRQIIAENFPEAEEARKEAEARKSDYAGTVDLSNADLSKLCALLGFARPAMPDWATASDEEKEAYFEACKPCDEFAQRVRHSGLLYNDDPIRLYYSALLKWFAEFYRVEADPKDEKKTARKATAEPKAKTATADTDSTEAPAEGLQLVEIPGGVAVVGGYYDTLRNRKAIKAHGARWNKEAKQWQATDAEAVARLREWFGVSEPKAEKQEQYTQTTASDNTEQQEQPEQPTAEEVARVARFAALLADVVAMFETIATAAQQEAQRAKETATKQAEAEQLRADIAKMSAQVAAMSEQLRTMSERLTTIEAEANADSTTAEQPTADNEPQPEAETQERPERGEGKPDALDMLRAAAEDVERLTAANDHTAALLARLYVLAAVGLRVRPLILRAKAIEAAQQRGHLTPDEVTDRQRISQETERRAALLLTPEEFRTLYGYDPKADSKAA
jgi:hypothetical protein